MLVEALAAPQPPAGLSAAANNYNVGLTWANGGGDASHFKVERSFNGTDWSEVGRVDVNQTSFADTKLNCNRTYHYRVQAVNGALASGYSAGAAATTAACPPNSSLSEPFTNSAMPAGWNVVNNVGSDGWSFDNPGGRPNETGGSGNFAIADSDHAGDGVSMDTELRTPVLNFAGVSGVKLEFKTHFKVYSAATADVDVSNDGGATWTNVWRKTGSFQGPVSLDLSRLLGDQSNVIVRFRYFAAQWDWYWQIDDLNVVPLFPPAAPAGLQASLAPNSAVNLSWTGNGAPGFKVERSTGGSWSQVADITDGATAYTDSGVQGNTAYSYRVKGYNGGGESDYSNAANVTTSDRNVSVYDLSVSFYGNPSAAQRAAIEGNIRYFADGVYEMSNGAQKLGRVTIYTQGRYADRANVIWIPSCHPNAYISGYAQETGPYKRIEHCDSFSGYNFLGSDTGQRAGGYTMAHEWGHNFHSVYDEYVQKDTACSGQIGSPCQGDTPVPGVLMNMGGWEALDGNYSGLNFSTALNNTRNTAQHRVYGASAWETITRPVSQDPREGARSNSPSRLYHPEMAAAAPGASQVPPVEMPGGQAAARNRLQFVWMDGSVSGGSLSAQSVLAANSSIRQIVIDSSSNMAGQLDDIKNAVILLIDQAQIDDTIGLIHFDGSVTTAYAVTDITGQAAKDALIAAVDGIAAGNSDVASGNALQAALTALTAPDMPTNAHRVIYLITGNKHTTGMHPASLISSCQANFIPVYTFGYGVDKQAAGDLQQIAGQTGGEYTSVDGFDSLMDALELADRFASPVVDINIKNGWATVNASTTSDTSIYVDSTLSELVVEVGYFGPLASATLSLIEPNSTSTNLTDCETWGDPREEITSCFITINNPMAGSWKLRTAAVDTVDLFYWAGGTAKDNELTFEALVESLTGDTVSYPDPIVIAAAVGKEFPITQGDVTGIIEWPDGSDSSFTLRDDGVAPDDRANDGIYGAIVDYEVHGDYTIQVSFNNNSGNAKFSNVGASYVPDPNGDTPGEQLTPVGQNFERFAELQVTVEGWQEDDHADWPDDPTWWATVLQADNTPVAGGIDYANDVDVFEITVPAGYTGTLGLRIDNLALDMDPYLYVYAADYAWEFESYLEYVPTSDDYLFVPIDVPEEVNPGETFYVEVWHYEETAETGLYDISVGPLLPSDPSSE